MSTELRGSPPLSGEGVCPALDRKKRKAQPLSNDGDRRKRRGNEDVPDEAEEREGERQAPGGSGPPAPGCGQRSVDHNDEAFHETSHILLNAIARAVLEGTLGQDSSRCVLPVCSSISSA